MVKVMLAELESQLRDIYRERRDRTLYISGHGSLRYGEIVAVIDAAKGGGVDPRRHHHRRHAARGATATAMTCRVGEECPGT